MTPVLTAGQLTEAEARRIVREVVRDKRYLLYPLGNDVANYMRFKRKRLTAASYRSYEEALDEFVQEYYDLRLEDFEPPVGTRRIEEFLDKRYGDLAAATYNKNLSVLGDFFEHQIKRQRLHGDPTTPIERARTRDTYRTTFTISERRAAIAGQDFLRDRIAMRLLFDYGLRKGALKAIQFKHFDHQRKRLTIFTKGGKVREIPIPDPAFWMDLERHLLDMEAQPRHYLMCQQKTIPRAGVRYFPEKAMSDHGVHRWWYRCLALAGIVAEGTTSGENMHKARHTAGQRVLDATGNLKAVQKLLGHSSIQTTADTYLDWDIDALTRTMAQVLEKDDDHEL